MPKKSGQTIFVVAASLLLFAVIVFLSVSKRPLQILPLIVVLVPIVFIITFINTDAALILLIFSMLLSPEIRLAQVPARAVVVRIDDILLFVIFFSWLAKMAINKQLGLLKRTCLNLPIACYVSVCVLATGIGILTSDVRPLKSFFYILKYVEYFMLYFLVTNNIRDKKQIKIFLVAFLITCALTCVYALATVGEAGRATAPFEGPQGEPNTLGGYLVLLFAIVSGLLLYSPSRNWRFCSGALTCLIFFTLLHTLSRGSYLAFIPMYLTLIILTRRKKLLLIGMLILAILILPSVMPAKVSDRIEKTFVPGRVYRPLGKQIALDDAAAARVETWKEVLDQWRRRPFLGYGVAGLGLIDSQYPLILAETGIIGFWVFGWLLLTIFRGGLATFKTGKEDWTRGLALGFLAGFVGLLVHSFAAATFIIVRIMEPFWFLTAIVVMLPDLQEASAEVPPITSDTI